MNPTVEPVTMTLVCAQLVPAKEHGTLAGKADVGGKIANIVLPPGLSLRELAFAGRSFKPSPTATWYEVIVSAPAVELGEHVIATVENVTEGPIQADGKIYFDIVPEVVPQVSHAAQTGSDGGSGFSRGEPQVSTQGGYTVAASPQPVASAARQIALGSDEHGAIIPSASLNLFIDSFDRGFSLSSNLRGYFMTLLDTASPPGSVISLADDDRVLILRSDDRDALIQYLVARQPLEERRERIVGALQYAFDGTWAPITALLEAQAQGSIEGQSQQQTSQQQPPAAPIAVLGGAAA